MWRKPCQPKSKCPPPPKPSTQHLEHGVGRRGEHACECNQNGRKRHVRKVGRKRHGTVVGEGGGVDDAAGWCAVPCVRPPKVL